MKKILLAMATLALFVVLPVQAGDAAAFLSSKVPTTEKQPVAKSAKKTKKRKKTGKGKEAAASPPAAGNARQGPAE